MAKVYVIEHMEPDEEISPKSLPDWVMLEYFHILQQVGVVGVAKRPSPKQGSGTVGSSQTLIASSSKSDDEPNEANVASSKVFFSQLSPTSSQSLIEEINSQATNYNVGVGPVARPLHVFPPSNLAPKLDLGNCVCSQNSVLDLMSILEVNLAQVCLLDPKAEQELKPDDGACFRWFLFGGILGDDPPRDRTAQLRVCGFPSRNLGTIQMTTDTAVAVTKRIVEDGFRLQDLPWAEKPDLVFNSKESVQMPFRYLAEPSGQPIMPQGMRELIRRDMDRTFEF
ncbi:hypothetical protein O181_051913 [Austropuccinia psidii MF-1]|uniref:Uncharacterized protein n=1 Tax=Austropuccinia psidii MF-1 TaxID=1389203 RepID=A0A9Q3HNU6_9BASI|nr:hypothetical protein [Austropuccinia psidii MF-1]